MSIEQESGFSISPRKKIEIPQEKFIQDIEPPEWIKLQVAATQAIEEEKKFSHEQIDKWFSNYNNGKLVSQYRQELLENGGINTLGQLQEEITYFIRLQLEEEYDKEKHDPSTQ